MNNVGKLTLTKMNEKRKMNLGYRICKIWREAAYEYTCDWKCEK